MVGAFPDEESCILLVTAMYKRDEVSREMANKESKSNRRHTAKEKKEIVLRLLKREPIEEVARELNLPARLLAQWRNDFIEAGTEGLKSRPGSLAEKKLKAAQAKIGELSMQVEILQEYLKKKGALATAADFEIF